MTAKALMWNHPYPSRLFPLTGRSIMARKYSKAASADVERAMKKRKAGTLKSGRSKKKVTSRKQAPLFPGAGRQTVPNYLPFLPPNVAGASSIQRME